MKRILKLLVIWLALAGIGFVTPFAQAQNFSSPPDALSSAAPSPSNVSVALKSTRAVVTPGERFYVAIEQKIAPGWHTYWRNPGDSGEPTEVAWTLPAGTTAGPIKWPAPTAIPFGPLVNYGFSNTVILPVEISVPAEAVVGTRLTLAAEIRWLECADICIPGNAPVSIEVSVGNTSVDSGDAAVIKTALAKLPGAFGGTTRLTDLGAEGLQLIVTGTDKPQSAYFFPHEIKLGAIIDSARPQKLVGGKDGFGLTLAKSLSFPAQLTGPVSGVLVLGKGNSARAYQIDAAFDVAPPSQTPLPKMKATNPNLGIGLWMALVMAFAGGLILNLMPCVLPILSMKTLGLVQAAHRGANAARTHGLWYGCGVMVSFLALAGALIALQSAGLAAGWGFQLQNPAIVVGLAILMVLIGFNLLGFFEIGTSLQNIGGDLAQKNGASGSFLTGVLAVIVAAPCTAPFMGAALGFAATQAPLISLLVFAALGLGFALPFVALTFAPALLRALPRPGPWMIRLREGLAFPMFATAIWLIWVASAQAGQAGLLASLLGILGTALAIWIARTWPNGYGKVAAIILGLGSMIWSIQHVLAALPQAKQQQSLTDNAWSEARVTQLQSEGKTVFVNFTADWCVTCKVNEISVFAKGDVRSALSGTKATYLVADWTNRNEAIAQALAKHGRVGIPLYLVYKPGQSEPEILPQILTSKAIFDAIS